MRRTGGSASGGNFSCLACVCFRDVKDWSSKALSRPKSVSECREASLSARRGGELEKDSGVGCGCGDGRGRGVRSCSPYVWWRGSEVTRRFTRVVSSWSEVNSTCRLCDFQRALQARHRVCLPACRSLSRFAYPLVLPECCQSIGIPFDQRAASPHPPLARHQQPPAN